MEKNVGPADRYIRFLVGVAFLVNIIILEPGFFGGVILLVLGGLMLFTSYTGSCALYSLLKISSCRESCGVPAEKADAAPPAH